MNGAALVVGMGVAREGLSACVNRRATNADKCETLAQSIRYYGLSARTFPGVARK